MDKEWMSKHRLSREYEEGVERILEFALQNCTDPEQIPCPCANCGNLFKTNSYTIGIHLGSFGVDRTYETWIFHGEKDRLSNTVDVMLEPNLVDIEKDEDPVHMVDDACNTYQDNPTQFRELLEDAEKPLYHGNMKFTRLSALVKLYNLKAKYGWSDTSFTALLRLLRQILPEGNELPSSLYQAKKTLRALGLTYEKIHACPNDCVLYRKEYKDDTHCPSCGLSRWKEMGKTKEPHVGIPSKVLWYFSPIPRFLRMYRNKEIGKELTWHADARNRDGKLRHPADAPAWKLVDHKWPNFGMEHRNLRLELSADGINPHSTMSSKYSCWPVLLVTYNLPPWLCMKRKFMMLTCLISGPRQLGNDIDVYLSPLVDDLKELWDKGIQAYDAYRKESFVLKDVLLWTINDFPAYGNLSGCSVKRYQACPVCGEGTCAKHLAHSRKISYTGHRRFLPRHHPYRRQKRAFDGQQDFNSAPRVLIGREILEKVNNIKRVWGETKAKKMKANEAKEIGKLCGKRKATKKSKVNDGESSRKLKSTDTEDKKDDKACFKKKSIFFDLEYWEHLHVRHCLDVMHIKKNVCESVIGTLLDIPGKTNDGIAARLDLLDMGVRTELAPRVGEKRTFLPPTCHTLSKEEKRKFCMSLSGMKVPIGYSSNIASLVSIEDLKLGGLKSHDYHTLMQQLLGCHSWYSS